MAEIKNIYEDSARTQEIYPITHEKAVIDNNGTTAETKFQMITNLVNQKQMEVGAVPSDLSPTAGSTKWAMSGGIYDALHYNVKCIFELGSIDTSTGEKVTQTNGTRMRNKDFVQKSSNVISYTLDRSVTKVNFILYENFVFKGSVETSDAKTAGSYTQEINAEYTWNQFKIVCWTTGATVTNVINNYALAFTSLKEDFPSLSYNVDAISGAMQSSGNNNVVLPLSESDYSYGNMKPAGEIVENDKVIYTTNAIDVRNAAYLTYSLDNSYRLGVASYDNYGRFAKLEEWYTGSGVHDIKEAASIRLVIAYPSGGDSFDYEEANPSFSVELLGYLPVASMEDLNEVLFNGRNYIFELGTIDGANGQLIEKTDGTRIRSKEYVPKGDGFMRLTLVFSVSAVNIICYKNGVYAGWIERAYGTLTSGDYVYKINVPFDYDSYKVVCFTTGATTATANNCYVKIPPVAYFGTNNDEINIEGLDTDAIYGYYDELMAEFPNYISKRVLGYDSSGQHEIREYVATLRDNYAYLYKERCYAWKNGSTIIYTESISPRVGDSAYTDQLTTSTGYTVSESDCNNGTITVNGVVYSRDTTDDISADIAFRNTGTSSTITVSGKTYTRTPNYDKSSICKKTIVSICNEHGPGSNGDPREPSVVMYYLLKALCGETIDNPQLDWLKRYAKLVIIPVANPYAYNEEGSVAQLGDLMGRVNANGVNINRNYPTTNWTTLSQNEAGAYGGSEVETQYNINCVMRHNADIAIDEHCLGPNSGNYNQWHYEGIMSNNISSETKMMMLSTYNLAYSSYGSNAAGHGDTWFEEQGKSGCLLEMNQGYGNTLHSDIILRADRQIWMGVLDYYDIFNL